MIRAPRPRSAPIHSPTIAPSTEVVEAIFSAEKRNGSELGTRSFQNTSALLADSTRMSSSDCGLTDVRPRTMLASVGKKQMNAAITTLEVIPSPRPCRLRHDRRALVERHRGLGDHGGRLVGHQQDCKSARRCEAIRMNAGVSRTLSGRG